ncbi:MAG: FG-GAP repeat protein, partial [Thermoplasmata archaeon]|nr:FG-GAP repeat protein [Thermoplasmata archaeon]
MAVFAFIVGALLLMMPMASTPVDAARLVNTFKDGENSITIEFTTDPLPGEVATVYLKVKADTTVVQATMKASAVMMELSNAYSLQAGPAFTLLNRGIDTSGDLNGDGLTELIITAPGANNNQGYIGGFAGRNTGYVTNPQEIIIQGTTNNDFLGWALSTGGDIDGDGYDDMVTSRIEMDFGTSTGTGTGDVLIWWGGTTMSATADVTLSYGASGDMFGYDVWADGDINGDGNMDLVVGAPRHEENTNNPGR